MSKENKFEISILGVIPDSAVNFISFCARYSERGLHVKEDLLDIGYLNQ